MKKTGTYIMAVGCMLLLTHCASQDELRDLQYQVRAVNQKVEDVKTNAVDQMRKRQASSVSKIDQVEDETLRIRSAIEETTAQNQGNIAALQNAVSGLRTEYDAKFSEQNARIQALEEKIAILSENFSKAQQARLNEAERKAQLAAQRAEEAKKRASTLESTTAAGSTAGLSSSSQVRITPASQKTKRGSASVAAGGAAAGSRTASTASAATSGSSSSSRAAGASAGNTETVVSTPSASSSASDPLTRAMEQYKGKKYADAYSSFEQALSTNPNGPQAARSLFYMGECRYAQGEYDLAILDYQKVISNHSKDSLTPNALLKQGMSFEKLTDHETAKLIYKKLMNDYGGSAEASQAKDRLSRL